MESCSPAFETKSAARRAFAHYLRTGQRLAERVFESEPAQLEAKFNPYHDPRNGRFTFAPGGSRSLSNVVTSDRRRYIPKPARKPSPPAAANANALAVPSRDLGALSARYESSAGGDPGKISTGKGDPGGISYGSYQLAANTGTAAAFVASPEARQWADKFNDLKPGTNAFNVQWRAVAARDPEAFQAAQYAYIGRTHYESAVKKVARATGYDLDKASEAIQQVTFSVAVQHGRAATILGDAVKRTDQHLKRTDPGYQAMLINNIYDRRSEYVKQLRDRATDISHARGFNNAIVNRYPQERADALNMLNRHR